MYSMRHWMALILFLLFTSLSYAQDLGTHDDPLPSWNEGPTKHKIIQFVQKVTDVSDPDYVQADERIATFDNDGTLWVEQPMYAQVMFMFDRVKALAREHPEWKSQEPYKTVISGNSKAIAKLTMPDLIHILNVTHSSMPVQDFKKIVKNWLIITKHPRFHKPYTDLIYQPMLEVMNYLRKNQFKVYIVTAGGQDFVRAYAQKSYSVTPDLVIGTINTTQYVHRDNTVEIIKQPDIFLVVDKKGKPLAINMFIGMHPLIAFGNSDGDREMLEWTQARSGPKLMLLVHHDDAIREYAYGAQSKIGTFSNALMKQARNNHWQIISMKNDWKKIFNFDK